MIGCVKYLLHSGSDLVVGQVGCGVVPLEEHGQHVAEGGKVGVGGGAAESDLKRGKKVFFNTQSLDPTRTFISWKLVF